MELRRPQRQTIILNNDARIFLMIGDRWLSKLCVWYVCGIYERAEEHRFIDSLQILTWNFFFVGDFRTVNFLLTSWLQFRIKNDHLMISYFITRLVDYLLSNLMLLNFQFSHRSRIIKALGMIEGYRTRGNCAFILRLSSWTTYIDGVHFFLRYAPKIYKGYQIPLSCDS